MRTGDRFLVRVADGKVIWTSHDQGPTRELPFVLKTGDYLEVLQLPQLLEVCGVVLPHEIFEWNGVLVYFGPKPARFQIVERCPLAELYPNSEPVLLGSVPAELRGLRARVYSLGVVILFLLGVIRPSSLFVKSLFFGLLLAMSFLGSARRVGSSDVPIAKQVILAQQELMRHRAEELLEHLFARRTAGAGGDAL